jgi:diguanylate cyclase (GGDEF)-like protein
LRAPDASNDNDTRAEIDVLRAELARAHARIAELEARADIDPLLDILNRRGFERELTRTVAYVGRYGTPAVLMYIDLDGFKAVNDRRGHATGDALLQAVVRELTGHVRASDVVGRLGGDEFGVIMWHVDAAIAAGKGRELERLIEAGTAHELGEGLSVGASVGLAAIDGQGTPAALIDAADRAMYARKRERRGS